MDGDNNNLHMRFYGLSLTRNGPIENNNFMSSISSVGEVLFTYNPATDSFTAADWVPGTPGEDQFASQYFVAFPVPIPATTGGWFENVTTAKVDSTGHLPLEDPYSYYNPDNYGNLSKALDQALGPYIPEYRYGFDPLWNVPATGTVNISYKDDEDPTIVNEIEWDLGFGFEGTPRPLDIYDWQNMKKNTTLAKRILVVYNDTDQALTNVKVRIADQTLKGAVTEIWNYFSFMDDWYYTTPDESFAFSYYFMLDPAYYDLVKTDGVNYTPEFAKFWIGNQFGSLENQTPNVEEEATIPYLGPAGTKEAWAFLTLTQYVTHENGNYAGTENDYMILATETE